MSTHIRSSNSPTFAHVPYLLTSYNVNDVTERAPRDENGDVKLIAQVAKEDFILHFATNAPIMVSSK